MAEFVESKIIIGLVVSTEYLQKIQPIWNAEYLIAPEAKTIALWCWEYFERYNKAPHKQIEDIYLSKLRNKEITEERAELISIILNQLNREYKRKQFNVEYLVDQTKKYFQERNLLLFSERIKSELDANNPTKAEEIACGFSSALRDHHTSIEPLSKEALPKIKEVFSESQKPLIHFPKALGTFWDNQMVRGGFIGLMGPEKRGKTFLLMEIAIQGLRSGCNVVFFQAGDMTEIQQLRRFCVYLAGKSDQPRYCKPLYYPVVDCTQNQLDTCSKAVRECDFGVVSDREEVRKPKYESLVELVKDNPEYKPCHNCPTYTTQGAVWMNLREEVSPLRWTEAYAKIKNFRKQNKARFKISTHPNETLRITDIKSLLHIWERQEGFVPDIIVVDYADILASDPDCTRLDFRNQNNKIWQRLRSLSEEKHCLVVTATQAAASSYDHDTLKMKDFSEDKRKYAHVTAMYGLNQTADEKKIGIMRLTELVLREGDFDTTSFIKILQRLQMGRPLLGSFR